MRSFIETTRCRDGQPVVASGCHQEDASMMKRFYYAGAFAAGILCGAATMALAQATSNAVVLSEPWSAVQTWILTLVGAVIASLIGWVTVTLNKKLGISIEDSMRNALQTATTNAAGLVLNKIGNQLQGKVLDLGYVGNDMVKYVMNAVPDATKHFGLTEERVANMILAKVPQVANITAAPIPAAPPPVV
jgi:hypothetical protein